MLLLNVLAVPGVRDSGATAVLVVVDDVLATVLLGRRDVRLGRWATACLGMGCAGLVVHRGRCARVRGCGGLLRVRRGWTTCSRWPVTCRWPTWPATVLLGHRLVLGLGHRVHGGRAVFATVRLGVFVAAGERGDDRGVEHSAVDPFGHASAGRARRGSNSFPCNAGHTPAPVQSRNRRQDVTPEHPHTERGNSRHVIPV